MYCIEIQPRIQAAHVVLSTVSPTISITCNSIDTTGTMTLIYVLIFWDIYISAGNVKTSCDWNSPKLNLSSQPIINVVAQVGLSMRFRTERDFLAEQIVENALSDSEGIVSCLVIVRCRLCNNPLTKTNK